MDLTAAHQLATGLLAEHGLTDWRVEYDAAKRRAGVCRYAQRTIGLSAPLTVLHDEAMVRDTVLHEIAHALVGPATATTRCGRAGPARSAAPRSAACPPTRRGWRPRGWVSAPPGTPSTGTAARSG